MKNLMTMGLVATVMFCISAGGSWFLQNRSHAPKEAAGDDAHGDGHAEESADGHSADAHAEHTADAGHDAHAADAGHSPTAAVAHGASSDHGAAAIPRSAVDDLKPLEHALPGSIRPRPVSVEELLRYSLGLKNREEAIVGREKDLERKQAKVNIALTDIQGEQHELDGLRRQVKEQLSAVDHLLSKVADERRQLEADKTEAQEQLKQYESAKQDDDAAQRDNVKRMAVWFQGIEPDKAASLLKSLANEGKMDLAIQLLSNFGEREASKVLGAIDDPALTVELAEAFRTFKRSPKK